MKMYRIVLISVLYLLIFKFSNAKCIPSSTTVSGTHAPKKICSGQLIFEDNFDNLDLKIWNHEESLSGGGNWEFQWYTNNRSNSFVENGLLHIQPTLLSDDRGENFLYSGTLDLNGNQPVDICTEGRWYGCLRTGTKLNILNPIKSAKIRTVNSFNFRYGKIEVRAKLPEGDWLWPAIWLMPRYNQYSTWPSSGEIDLIESRGNLRLIDKNGRNIGSEQISGTLNWGPNSQINLNNLTHFEYNSKTGGFHETFHRFSLEWSQDRIAWFVDDEMFGEIVPPDVGGFWELANLTGYGLNNPWKGATKMAPFDQEFYLIINVAVGGVNGYFPDTNEKPWYNNSTTALTDFWQNREQWLPTWKLEKDASSLKIDYVKVWAL